MASGKVTWCVRKCHTLSEFSLLLVVVGNCNLHLSSLWESLLIVPWQVVLCHHILPLWLQVMPYIVRVPPVPPPVWYTHTHTHGYYASVLWASTEAHIHSHCTPSMSVRVHCVCVCVSVSFVCSVCVCVCVIRPHSFLSTPHSLLFCSCSVTLGLKINKSILNLLASTLSSEICAGVAGMDVYTCKWSKMLVPGHATISSKIT